MVQIKYRRVKAKITPGHSLNQSKYLDWLWANNCLLFNSKKVSPLHIIQLQANITSVYYSTQSKYPHRILIDAEQITPLPAQWRENSDTNSPSEPLACQNLVANFFIFALIRGRILTSAIVGPANCWHGKVLSTTTVVSLWLSTFFSRQECVSPFCGRGLMIDNDIMIIIQYIWYTSHNDHMDNIICIL